MIESTHTTIVDAGGLGMGPKIVIWTDFGNKLLSFINDILLVCVREAYLSQGLRFKQGDDSNKDNDNDDDNNEYKE